jgi:hypothetical protein
LVPLQAVACTEFKGVVVVVPALAPGQNAHPPAAAAAAAAWGQKGVHEHPHVLDVPVLAPG